MKSLLIIGIIQLLTIYSFGQTKLCLESDFSGSTCYYLDSGNIVTFERHDFTSLVVVRGFYKKTKRLLTICLNERVIQVRKNFDTTLTGMIKITHQLHASPKDSLKFSTIKYLNRVYQPDIYGTVILPYFGGEIEIKKYSSSEIIVINPMQQVRESLGHLRVPRKEFNEYDIYWSNGILVLPEPTFIKMKKNGDKYEVRFKSVRIGPMDQIYNVWEKCYFIETM